MSGNQTACGRHLAPNGATCLDGGWGVAELCVVIGCALYVATVLTLRRRKLHRASAAPATTQPGIVLGAAVSRPTSGPGAIPVVAVGAVAGGDGAALLFDDPDDVRWLHSRAVQELLRLLATGVLLAKAASALDWEDRGWFELKTPWPVAVLPWVAFDLAVATNLWRGWRAGWVPPLQRMLSSGYTTALGLPLGTVFKIVVALELAGRGKGGGGGGGGSPGPLAIAVLALGVCAATAAGLVAAAVGAAPASVRGRGILLAAPVVYLALSMLNMLRIATPAAGAVGLGGGDGGEEGGFWAAFPANSWFGVLTPIWAVLGGAALAAIVDVAAAVTAAEVSAAGRRRAVQRRTADALPLIGVLGTTLIITSHFDAADPDAGYGAAGRTVPWGCLVPMAVCETLALLNLGLVACQQRGAGQRKATYVAGATAPPGGVVDTFNRNSNATDSGVTTLRDSAESRLSLAEELFAGGSESGTSTPSTSSRRSSSGRRSVTAYGQPYIDNPSFMIPPDDGVCVTATEESVGEAPARIQPRPTARRPREPTPREAAAVEKGRGATKGAAGGAAAAAAPPTDSSAAATVYRAASGPDGAGTPALADDFAEIKVPEYPEIKVSGTPVTRDTVRIGMCVYVDPEAADPQSGLYGDTIGCGGMVGVVSQADESDTCQVLLTDGRQQWVQCRALVYVDDPASTVVSADEWDGLPLSLYSISDPSAFGGFGPLSVNGHPQLPPDESDALRAAYACIDGRDVDGLRRAIHLLEDGEIDTALRRKTLLQAAAADGQLAAVSLLLSSGANPDSVDSGGSTALHAAMGAASREDGAAIAAALIEAGCDKNLCNGLGLAPLHAAAAAGHTLAAELLVAMGCQVDLRTRGTSETPVFLAIKAKALKIVRLLVEQGGCNVSAADGEGDTPLHLSLVMAADDPGCLEVAKYLIANGANAVHRNQRGLAALDVCPPDAFADVKQAFISAQVQTLLEHHSPDAPGTVKAGWRVRVRKTVEAPRHGWQGGTREDVLVVRQVIGDELVATFVDPDIPLRFGVAEVERVFDTFGVKLTASTNAASVYNVFKPDRERYWQSDGERGLHWIELELPQTAEVSALELQVHEGGVAFIPKRVEVLVGQSPEPIGGARGAASNDHRLTSVISTEVVSYGWTAMIPNHSQLRARVIRLAIRSCHESGINCRISGIRFICSVQGTELSVPSSLGGFTPIPWEDVSVGTESGSLLKGRYRLGRKLAKGGYGVTYAATDEDCLGEAVVIKFLHRLHGLALFRREARRLHEIQHPQIPKLKAYFELKDEAEPGAAESKFVLVMELVPGRNLVEVLDDEGIWAEADARAMLLSVLAVLRHVHNKGVLHRDIKASNVMRRDADGQYFVIDFGASANTASSEDEKIIGTPGYMAPEVQLGKACCESDLFSLGALGLYVLTGVEPYRLIDKVRGDRPYSGALGRLEAGGTVQGDTLALLDALLLADPDRRRVALHTVLPSPTAN